jgi:hypothetical protein
MVTVGINKAKGKEEGRRIETMRERKQGTAKREIEQRSQLPSAQ